VSCLNSKSWTRNSLPGPVAKTSELAKQGHAGAKMVLDGLQITDGTEQKAGQ
jgi:hypothetical protein